MGVNTQIYQFVLDNFTRTRLSYKEIAEGAEMSKRTVEKIARREIKDPGVSSVEKLAAFFASARQ